MSKRLIERRYDRYGEFRLMAEAEGWVMYRRKGCAADAMMRKEWDALSREPVEMAMGRQQLGMEG